MANLPDFNDFRPRARVLLDKRQTGADVAPVHAFDTTPETEQDAVHEMKVRAALKGMTDALQRYRGYISIEQLMAMTNVRPELEGELPEIDGIRHGMFIFTVSGKYQGRTVTRCLLGGDVILISAASPHEARRIAAEGLQDTIRAGQQYAQAVAWGVDVAPKQNLGISFDTEALKRK